MKKRILAVLICLVIFGTAGCGGNSAKENSGEAKSGAVENENPEKAEETTGEGEEYVTWIKEAWEEYKSSEVRGFVESKFQGSQREVNTIDSGKQQWMTLSYIDDSGTEPMYTYFRTKEGEKDYTFKKQQTGEDTFEYLKVQIDPNTTDEESYSRFIENENLPIESNDDTEVISISAVQEGEEDINGVKALKIEVTYETKLKSPEKITRESVMNEHGWTEEEFAAMSDFHLSELIDAYVDIANSTQEAKANEPQSDAQTYYLSSDDHKLLRKVETISEASEYPYTAMHEISSLMRNLKINTEYDTLEGSAQQMTERYLGDWDYEWLMQSMAEDISSSSATEITVDYQTGDECEPCEIPAEAKEITWEQYNTHDF